MNSRIGPISFPSKKNTDYGKKPYSDKLARMIDEVTASHLVINPRLSVFRTRRPFVATLNA